MIKNIKKKISILRCFWVRFFSVQMAESWNLFYPGASAFHLTVIIIPERQSVFYIRQGT